MNVDDAMAYASKDKCFWAGEVHTALETLSKEVERLRAELAQFRKDWCDDDEAIKQQALRVLDAAKVEGDSVYVPRMGALAEMMADEMVKIRAELAEAGDGDTWREACGRIEAELAKVRLELAAAKAASVCPVDIVWFNQSGWGQEVNVELKSEEDAVALMKWLREQMKERGEG
jgi:hypothetical protein